MAKDFFDSPWFDSKGCKDRVTSPEVSSCSEGAIKIDPHIWGVESCSYCHFEKKRRSIVESIEIESSLDSSALRVAEC